MDGVRVRNALEAAISVQAVRITGLTDPSPEQVRELLIGDLPEGLSDSEPVGTGLYI